MAKLSLSSKAFHPHSSDGKRLVYTVLGSLEKHKDQEEAHPAAQRSIEVVFFFFLRLFLMGSSFLSSFSDGVVHCRISDGVVHCRISDGGLGTWRRSVVEHHYQ
jgi:hypothetical protein